MTMSRSRYSDSGISHLENFVSDGSERSVIRELGYFEDVNTPNLDIVEVLAKLVFIRRQHTVLWHLVRQERLALIGIKRKYEVSPLY